MGEHFSEYLFKDLVEKFKDTDRIILCIGDAIVDVTDYCSDHPGGSEILSEYRLRDPEETLQGFKDAEHTDKAKFLVDGFSIGKLISETKEPDKTNNESNKYKYVGIFVTVLAAIGIGFFLS